MRDLAGLAAVWMDVGGNLMVSFPAAFDFKLLLCNGQPGPGSATQHVFKRRALES